MAESHRPTAQLVTITATDGLLLPALYYKSGRGAPLVIWLHGMGPTGSFYAVDRINALATSLNSAGVAFLALNNRGAGMLQSIKYVDEAGDYQKVTQGTSHELIADCVKDINGAVKFARDSGHDQLFLVGHSTGANKICVYNSYEPKNPFLGYVLFGGGDDTGLFYLELGRDRFYDLMQESKLRTEQGRGDQLVPQSYGVGAFSYQSLADILDPDGDYNSFPFTECSTGVKLSTKGLFHDFKTISKPTLIIYGELDEYCPPSAREAEAIMLAQSPNPNLLTAKLVLGADHSAHNHEAELAADITDWVINQLKEQPK
jgi:alpha-beta hydrolase superfamily lysophospholipase